MPPELMALLTSASFGSGGDARIDGAVGFGTIPFAFEGAVVHDVRWSGEPQPRLVLQVQLELGAVTLGGALLAEGTCWVSDPRELGRQFALLRGTYADLAGLFSGDRPVRSLVREEKLFGSFGQLSYLTYLVTNDGWRRFVEPLVPAARASVAAVQSVIDAGIPA
ncbi:MAG: hypothetical protein U0V73_03685 [Acidimicrobiia bacterium]